MGEPPDRLTRENEATSSRAVASSVHRAIRQQSQYWACMVPKTALADFGDDPNAERMHDVVRTYQNHMLFNHFRMIPLHIRRDRISKSFQNQVLATADWSKKSTVIVIAHEPPDVRGQPDPTTNELQLHQLWISDPVNDYIKWGYGRGYGIVDINIPQHLTGISDPDGRDMEETTNLHNELMDYLWDNYLEISEAKNVIILAVGEPSSQIARLFSRRDLRNKLSGVVSFISNSVLRAVTSQNDEYLPDWYFERSRVYVGNEHSVWASSKRPKKKFGDVHRSPETTTNGMLIKHFDDTTNWLVKLLAKVPPQIKTRGSSSSAAAITGLPLSNFSAPASSSLHPPPMMV